MSEYIRAQITARGITRLCHFTPSHNFGQIAGGGHGLLSIKELDELERAVYTQQDLQRLDNHPDHISCSIEYPNAWYFRQRIGSVEPEIKLYRDWVILGINPLCLAGAGTLFCPRNAAAEAGTLLQPGDASFDAMYADKVLGAYGKWRYRTAERDDAVPTDDQAEAMIERQISIEDIDTVFVRDEEQAMRERLRLRLSAPMAPAIPFVIAPAFYEAKVLSKMLARGEEPMLEPWPGTVLDA